MKVIFLKDVRGVGRKNELKEVPDGYARNFLIPKNLAKHALVKDVNSLAQKESDAAAHKKNLKEKAEATAAAIKGKTFTFRARIGEKGALFGSIGINDISEKLKNAGYTGTPILEKNIKETGTKEITIDCGEGVRSKIFIEILPE